VFHKETVLKVKSVGSFNSLCQNEFAEQLSV